MNYIDIILTVLLAFGVVQGLRHGLVKELASVIAVIIGIYVARYWSDYMSRLLVEWTGWSMQICTPLAYVLVFIVVALIIHALSYIISKILSAVMLGWVNRILGAVFGFVKLVLIISVILNLLTLVDSVVSVKDRPGVKNSVLYDPLEAAVWNVLPFLKPEELNLKGLIESVGAGA